MTMLEFQTPTSKTVGGDRFLSIFAPLHRRLTMQVAMWIGSYEAEIDLVYQVVCLVAQSQPVTRQLLKLFRIIDDKKLLLLKF